VNILILLLSLLLLQNSFAKAPQGLITTCYDPFTTALYKDSDQYDRVQDLIQARLNSKKAIIIDIGGEGRYLDAININPYFLTSTTGEPNRFIPNWIYGFADDIPIQRSMVDVLYLENAPLSTSAMEEILRVIRPRGKIHLSHPSDYAEKYLDDLYEVFSGHNIKINHNSSIIEIDIEISLTK
jgi:hypothetical protein